MTRIIKRNITRTVQINNTSLCLMWPEVTFHGMLIGSKNVAFILLYQESRISTLVCTHNGTFANLLINGKIGWAGR